MGKTGIEGSCGATGERREEDRGAPCHGRFRMRDGRMTWTYCIIMAAL